MPPLIGMRTPRCMYSVSYRCLSSSSISAPASASTTTKRQIPPESPKYIDVPESLQPEAIKKPIIKGVLPIPRQLFPRNGPDKTSPSYLAAVTLEPKSTTNHRTSSRETQKLILWKAQQAESRRRNLRESLVELHHRKERTDRHFAAKGAYRRAEHERLIAEPEREDERLNAPSVLQSMLPAAHVQLSDPDREARVAGKRARVAAIEAAKQEERRNALHTLYMNAGRFIVTENQLNSTIDKEFDDLKQFNNDTTQGLNIWNVGYPETVQELLNQANRGSVNGGGKAVERNVGFGPVTKERMRKISEELTGGKMGRAGAL